MICKPSRATRNPGHRHRNGLTDAQSSSRVELLPGACEVAWLGDWHGGVVVTPGDVIRKAAPGAVVHI